MNIEELRIEMAVLRMNSVIQTFLNNGERGQRELDASKALRIRRLVEPLKVLAEDPSRYHATQARQSDHFLLTGIAAHGLEVALVSFLIHMFTPGHSGHQEAIVAVVFRELLGEVTSLIGALIRLGSCREGPTDQYRDPRLAAFLNAETAHTACAVAHTQLWRVWIQCSLKEQHADTSKYIQSLNCAEDRRLSICLSTFRFEQFAPLNIPEQERHLALSNLSIIFGVLFRGRRP